MTRYSEDSDELAGGQWVTDRGVRRWVADPPSLTAVPDAPKPTELVACPTCHAKVGQTCRTRSGHTTTPHLSRLAPRLCQCGELLKPRARYCPPCRYEVNRINKRDHLRRLRAALTTTQKESA